MLKHNQVLAGRYRIESDAPIGLGDAGDVWKATDVQEGLPVAIRVLPEAIVRDDAAARHIERKVTNARGMKHLNICSVHDFYGEGDIKFIVRDFVEGVTLKQLAARSAHGRMAWSDLKPIAYQMAAALDYAHAYEYSLSPKHRSRGILHRDVNPWHVMVLPDGTAKFTDFGVTREIRDAIAVVTRQPPVISTYASREQVRGELVTSASDIYSYALTLYECLSGRRLVTPDEDLRSQIVDRPFEPIPDVEAQVNEALRFGLEKVATLRPASAASLFVLFPDAAIDTKAIPTLMPDTNETPLIPHDPGSPDAPTDPIAATPTSGTAADQTATEDGETKRKVVSIGPKQKGWGRIRLVWIPPGEFQMGSPEDEFGRDPDEIPHSVRISQGFFMGITTVTASQYYSVMGGRRPRSREEGDKPAQGVTYEQCLEFCKVLSEKEGRKYRLPTEAEWEYACRAGAKGSLGGTGDINSMAWYRGNSENELQTVGQMQPNMWGLYDMHGNIAEWCADWYGKYSPDRVQDPKGPKKGKFRVVRGGAWMSPSYDCRCAHRGWRKPDVQHYMVGFRIAMTLT